jgi:DNA-binding NarL/FixJ family response regulator
VQEPIRVLIVDDTPHVRKMLVMMLSVDDLAVVGDAEDGPTAIQACDDLAPDVVVLDFKMPDMDGLETARQIKAKRPDQDIIMYSAFIDDALEAAAADVGIALCLGKVEGLAVLEQEIRRLCRRLSR